MGLSSALSNAFSGLSVNSRLAEVASENVANALTEGFARRDAQLSPRMAGSVGIGVRIVSIERQVNEGIVQDLRTSTAGLASNSVLRDFYAGLEAAFGVPTNSSSVSARLARFESALIAAAVRPESEARLATVVTSARDLATGLNTAGKTLRDMRQAADRGIAADITALKHSLTSVDDLNDRIVQARARGQDTSALLDQRQSQIDRISELVSVRQVEQPNGSLSLFTAAGSTLLDGRVATIEFAPTAAISPSMSIGSGQLSGLSIDGQPVTTAPAGGIFGTGRIAAQFALRDDLAVTAQAQLDALAIDLFERFSDPAVDPTLAPGQAGLFDDAMGPFVPATSVGLAGRLIINGAVDPDQGGAVWRLRDGINAGGPSSNADPARLQAYSDALAKSRALSAPGLTAAGGVNQLIGEAGNGFSTARLRTDQEKAFAAARVEGLKSSLLADGVDTDREMQDLMQIDKAFAANAKVIQAVDEMLQLLLEI